MVGRMLEVRPVGAFRWPAPEASCRHPPWGAVVRRCRWRAAPALWQSLRGAVGARGASLRQAHALVAELVALRDCMDVQAPGMGLIGPVVLCGNGGGSV